MYIEKKAGYIIEEKNEYSDEDYERCANVISDYIMNHSKNDIPKIQREFSSILRKIIRKGLSHFETAPFICV